MAVHEVKMKMPKASVLYSDVEFEVRADNKKLGELHVSQGGIEWIPVNAKKQRYRRSWEDFRDWVEGKG